MFDSFTSGFPVSAGKDGGKACPRLWRCCAQPLSDGMAVILRFVVQVLCLPTPFHLVPFPLDMLPLRAFLHP